MQEGKQQEEVDHLQAAPHTTDLDLAAATAQAAEGQKNAIASPQLQFFFLPTKHDVCIIRS